MHPLRRYLTELEEPVQDFARRVGVSRQTLYRIITGSQSPKPGLARRIVEATGRAVSFEALYDRPDQSSGACDASDEERQLEHDRIRQSLAIVAHHLAPDSATVPEDAFEIAAEAVLNTYVALSNVTTRQGHDRLYQALRPVLEEILREYLGPISRSDLDRGAKLATQLYYKAWQPDRRRQSEPRQAP